MAVIPGRAEQSGIYPAADANAGPIDTALVASVPGPAEAGEEGLYPMSPEREAKLAHYSRFVNWWRFADLVIDVGLLWLLLISGFSARMRSWAQVARKRFLVVWAFLAMFITARYLLGFPFHFYRAFVVENQFGFSNQSFAAWLSEDLLGLLVTAVIGIIPVWFLYRLMERVRRWWLAFTVAAVPFMVFFVVVAPVVIDPLFNKFEPLPESDLRSEINALASAHGLAAADIFQVNASQQSSRINAYVTGLFGSKRVVLYDTMIDNFTIDEVKFVVGHEMGHYLKHHLWWGLLVAVILIGFGLWLISLLIDFPIRRFSHRFGFDRASDIASLPLVMIFAILIFFVIRPIPSAAGRLMERQCDRFAVDVSGVSAGTAVTCFEKLSAYNLSDPDPHPLIEFWFYSHPSIKKRIAFVRSYQPQP
jgi:Zn-dependent protease with chaperone function